MTSALWFAAGWLASYAFCALVIGLPLLLGRWLARRRIKRAVRELVGTGTWRYPARSQW